MPTDIHDITDRLGLPPTNYGRIPASSHPSTRSQCSV